MFRLDLNFHKEQLEEIKEAPDREIKKTEQENNVQNDKKSESFEASQILAWGMLKTVLTLKTKNTQRQFVRLLKQLQDNKEELV